MAEIVGVRFKRAGKVYYFDPADIELEVNDHVIVETAQGLEMGQVTIAPKQVLASDVENPLKPVMRKANPEDIGRARELEEKEREALAECGKLINKLNLQMKLLSAEYNFDGSRLVLYFSAAERVDFRELVRELAGLLKVRMEMRQTGPRDEARLVGGCGRCGRPLCCASFLSEFSPVSMRMAKDQGLPLNPMKISGCCGRLMCCLVYENEQYRQMKGKLPKNGQWVTTAKGRAKVVGSNPLKEAVMVELEDRVRTELLLSEITLENQQPDKQRK
ncbi:MAG: stage 0 sporulation family protein [Dehalococcoidales bacterium]|jgi:cell fate regulator YaaT (PSP1 superfamily)|nr:stage 0 sporulation family protein [Dehalococcoidales bacterium]